MPELPEVQTTVMGLKKRVLGRTFVNVWSDWQKIVKRPKSFSVFKKELRGKKILRVWRRAKNVIFELSDGYSLLIHMKMTGHLLVEPWNTQDPTNGYLHVVFFLDDGRKIALSDLRKFAKIELLKTSELMENFEALGPEPLEKTFTFEKFSALFLNKKGKVKQVIMKPEFIAGIGNIYASEALWEAKIHPAKNVSGLSKKELVLLYKAIRKVLALGVKFGGDSFSDYRDVEGNKGKFEGQKKVYQREKQPCLRCRTPVRRVMLGQRSSFFCPNCQKL